VTSWHVAPYDPFPGVCSMPHRALAVVQVA
jgi:hypothetical protein